MRGERLAMFLLTLLVLGACGSAPTTRYYVLAPTPPTLVGDSSLEGLRVGVEPFTVDPPYDRDQLVYRLGVDSVEGVNAQ